ncbi:MAG: hypothetical protein KJ580_00530, partial [Nanoarchaeota archaeon]|nr:hypothetical protein [Nanoarchaeota archaeon]
NITGDVPTARKGAAGYYLIGDDVIVLYGGGIVGGDASNDVYRLAILPEFSQAPQTFDQAPVKRIDVYLDGAFRPNVQPHDDGLNGDWRANDSAYTYIWYVSPGEIKRGEHILSLKAIESYCEYDSIEWPYAVMEGGESTPGITALIMDTYPELYFDAPSDFDMDSIDINMLPQSEYPLNIAGGIAKIEMDPATPGSTGYALTVEVIAKYLLLGCGNIEYLEPYIRDVTGAGISDDYMGEEWRLTKHPDFSKATQCFYYVSKPFGEMPGTYLIILQGKNLDGTPSNRYPFLTVDP